MISILAIDPGTSTGVAWGIFDPKAATAVEAVAAGLEKGSTTVTGETMAQARELFHTWKWWQGICDQHEPLFQPKTRRLVIEEFILFPGAHAGGREGVNPLVVGWAFEGYRQGKGRNVTPAIWQTSSVGMKSKPQLRKADCWVRGKEHERAAFCHIISRMKKEMR